MQHDGKLSVRSIWHLNWVMICERRQREYTGQPQQLERLQALSTIQEIEKFRYTTIGAADILIFGEFVSRGIDCGENLLARGIPCKRCSSRFGCYLYGRKSYQSPK